MRDKIIQAVFKELKIKKQDTRHSLISIDPATNKKLACVETCTASKCKKTIQAAHNAFLSWRNVPAPKRGELIRQIGNKIREHKNALATLISVEMGKILPEALGEVQEMIDMADFAVGQSRMLYGLSMHSERVEHRMLEQWHPLGVVGIISAFNFPMAVWAWNAFLAVISGNTVIWKPSSKTPLCAIAIQNICDAVMKENNISDIFSLTIFEDKSIGNILLDSPIIPLISFTGSTSIGQFIQDRVSKRLGKCLLELGGNNAIIVDETADNALASRAILFSAVGTAGQRCTTVRRLMIHEKKWDGIISVLQNVYHTIKIGDPLNKKTIIGPLIDANAVLQHKKTLSQIAKVGGKIIATQNKFKPRDNFVSPVIISAKNDWEMVQQETFSPILYVMTYKNFKDAVEMNNTSHYGLSSALFTNNLKNAEYFLSSLGSDCGIANINIGTSGAEIGGAFGGEKKTGGGREAGSDAWKTYMRRQTNTINWSDTLPLAQGIKFG